MDGRLDFDRMLFKLVPGGFSYLKIRTAICNLYGKKNTGFRNMQENLENTFFSSQWILYKSSSESKIDCL